MNHHTNLKMSALLILTLLIAACGNNPTSPTDDPTHKPSNNDHPNPDGDSENKHQTACQKDSTSFACLCETDSSSKACQCLDEASQSSELCQCVKNPSAEGCSCTLDSSSIDCICSQNPNDARCVCLDDPQSEACLCQNPESLDCVCAQNPEDERCICHNEPQGKECFCLNHPEHDDCTMASPFDFCITFCQDPKTHMETLMAHSAYKNADCDHDGLSNEKEITAPIPSDPCNHDTDGDGLSDGDEIIIYDTDPTNKDTDDDGLDDGDEVRLKFNPKKKYTLNDKTPDGKRWVVNACDNIPQDTNSYQSDPDGQWKIAIPSAVDYEKVHITTTTQGDRTAAAVIDDQNLEISSGIISMAPPSGVNDSISGLNNLYKILQRSTDIRINAEFVGGRTDTHDGAEAATGEFTVTVSNQSTKALRNTLLAAFGPFQSQDISTDLPTGGKGYAQFTIKATAIYRRSKISNNDRVIVIYAITPTSIFTKNERVVFRMEDFTNTTNLARPVDQVEWSCVIFRAVEAQPKSDFYFVLDESGSMNSANESMIAIAKDFWTRLESTDLDFRVGVTNIEFDNMLDVTGQNGAVMRWTKKQSEFQDDVQKIVKKGGGSEEGLKIGQAGITYMLSASTPPSKRIRPDANLIVTWITDEEESDFQGGINQTKLNAYKSFYKSVCTAFAFVTNRSSKVYNGESYRQVAQYTGGAFADLDKKQFTPTINAIVETAAGLSSAFRLPSTPISSTIQLYKNQLFVSRSRNNGFDYNNRSNAIAFYGNAIPVRAGEDAIASPGDDIVVTFNYYRLRSKD